MVTFARPARHGTSGDRRPTAPGSREGEAMQDAEAKFCAAVEIATQTPAGFLDHLAGILADHMPPARKAGEVVALDFYGAQARLEERGGTLAARATALDRGALANMKYLIAWNMREFFGPDVEIAWSGDGAGTSELPQFREMQVVDSWQVTRKMRRVRLVGHDLERFRSGGLHVQLLIPPKGRAPVWPNAVPSGIPAWPEGEDRLTLRTYTMRRLDPGAGCVDIDVVLHDGDSPGSDWARAATAGDPVGMMGPGGGGVLPAARMLLAGDETALPAIARMLEELPAEATGTAIIEIADAAEIQSLDHPAGFDLIWLDRRGRAAGTTTLLEEAVVDLDWPSEAGASVWIGCEFQAFKRLRHHCRRHWGLKARDHLVVAYWRAAPDEASGQAHR
ncbi:siderophore-interacting protein [Aurantimonas sp. A2-1-M11]|uniref:siderophore-interacting protein n=1 Tax=Aurantimonas sp. A2-1-M11 TaxID=3113712 RepID=UPI002F922F06